MNRLLIYSHFNRNGGVSDHVQYQIERVSSLCAKSIFVSNSPVEKGAQEKVLSVCDEFVQRKNEGYDFSAWKEVLGNLGSEEVCKYDVLILMNDTCFGPLRDLGAVFDEMEKRGCDFWGISSHSKMNKGMPVTNSEIPYHLQSYFMVFNRNVVMNDGFSNFWSGVELEVDVDQVIKKYESQLTFILERLGFKSGCWIEKGDRELPNPNYATWCPDFALVEGSPFLKVKAFQKFPNPRYLIHKVRETSCYPVSLIEAHINSVFNPNESALVNPKTLPISEGFRLEYERGGLQQPQVAVHIHVFYIDVLEGILKRFKTQNSQYYFYFSTSSSEKGSEIADLVRRIGIQENEFEICVFPNIGRDIYPWLQLAGKLSKFPIACHLHTKKTAWASTWVGESWMDQIIRELVQSAEQIIGFLVRNPEVGIVIPDVPVAYQSSLGSVDPWGANRELICKLWRRMGCSKPIRWEHLSIPIMPFGSMFWYRPEALRPLMDLNLAESEFPEEPLPPDGTLAHAIERLPVYLAWERGFDFRIAREELDKASFLEHVIRSEYQQSSKIYRMERKLYLIENSVTWRVRTRIVETLKGFLGR